MPKLDAGALRRKREKLEAEMEVLRLEERDREERRCAIAGRAVLDHAAKDHAFAETLARVLDASVHKKGERVLLDLPKRSNKPKASRSTSDQA